ncbi:MAG: NYN domain-containing protein [Gemmatimonadota bacterium]
MRGEESRTIIVDGSNVAHSSEGDRAQLSNIRVVRDRLVEEGYEPIIFADAALRHQIDDEAAFEQMVDSGEIRQAPAGTDADYFILSFARELEADVLSNDRFKDRVDAFPESRERVIRYMIINGEVVFERRTKKRRQH